MFTGLILLRYKLFPLKVDPLIDQVLENHLPYFKDLNRQEKKRFANRVQLFLKFIKFNSSSDFRITPEMKIIMSGAAVQFSFGLKRFIFRYYRNIFIMPSKYRIPELSNNLLGHVDKTKQTITLSWPNIEYGFAITDDAHNVALHEIAHVIIFENTLRLGYEEFFSRFDWDNWMNEAQKRFLIMQTQKSKVLSNYANTNLLEMFAVSVETFFEQPAKLQEHLPDLYAALMKLFNQDPRNRTNPVLK
jgi:Mlc titration factor MtfA (ptsG expression regulator)